MKAWCTVLLFFVVVGGVFSDAELEWDQKISAITEPSSGACLCAQKSLRVLKEAGSVSSVLTVLERNECYFFNGGKASHNGELWYEVRIGSGLTRGWVLSEHVQASASSSCANNTGLTRGAPFTGGIVSQDCLRCICLQESNCRPIGCRMDVGSLSCGYFQIKEAYWIDCYKPGTSWKSCANDVMCSSLCVQKYMERYAKYFGCPMECEGFAREHNGGPRGCKNPATLKYWERLQQIPGCKGVK